jgi:photosystem II stability/assembly factor-like uncharacterized protein
MLTEERHAGSSGIPPAGAQIRGRCVSGLLFLLTVLLFDAMTAATPARADDSVAMELNRPATITPRARDGLFTSIANAGSRLVAVGEQGRIMLSDDDGVTWRQVATPTSVTLTKVRFATPLQGWAVGQMGIVLHTEDGGLTWQKQFDDIAAGQIMLKAAQAAVAAQGSNAVTQANLQAAQIMVQGGPNVPFLTVLPVSQHDVLIAGGFGIAFESHDGGASWQSIAAAIPNPNGLHIYDFTEVQGSLFGVGEQGFVLRGAAAGPFTALTPPSPGSLFGALTLPDQSLMVYGLQGTILRSTDKGKDWLRPASNVSVGIDCGIVLRNGDVVLGDVAGDLLVSHDDGAQFSVLQAEEPVVALAQAADGEIIIGGPSGLMRMSPATLDAGA